MSTTHLGKAFNMDAWVTAKNKTTQEQYEKYLIMTEQTAAKKLFDLCKLYQEVRPALLTVKSIVFFLPKLKGQLTLLIDTLDTICPGNDI